MKYCKRCVMPDTRPDLSLDEEGVCSACRSYERRTEVDWDARRKELEELLERYRSRNGTSWDCIVPVSGGKDSTYQVVRMLQMGLNPLCVTATTCDLSDIGRRNIENLKNLGVDYVEFTTNREIRRRLNRIGLLRVGDISWPEHASIFTIPVRAAVQFGVPLIVWGENSQNEYGGPAAASENNVLTRKWLERFGGLLGLTISDLIGTEGLEAKHLIPYTYPSDEEMARVGVTGIFLGHYIPWDGYSNALISQAHGLTTYPSAIEGSCVNYENLDNYQTGVHDYFKFLKFGFGRTSDLTSLHVRRGRMTREDACAIVRRLDGKFPWSYLGKPLEAILDPLELTVGDFIELCDRYTNKELFVLDSKGDLKKDRRGNLIKKYDAEDACR
ncbi:N-acetyl sugar amidotransferase [Aminomonas paucivorans DSM 12260]|uniref:N-acetyl sugar amidotransferase n=1 Tax=Aminomonas paucivorans DSM 12260 TaxID=584708 RepID=E3CXE4_9BACT|nr:N-acetyl sugar amidotransferase [Aminomonas paucivorans]EFQ23510.1 N-acetyl sugar amidotransferase [Aminomonas paucivorans DSM 12260]